MPEVIAVHAGEVRRLAFDFFNEMLYDESITCAEISVDVWAGNDANAAALLCGSAEYYRFHAEQSVGHTSPAKGFQPGVIYRVSATVTTSREQRLIKSMIVRCVVPALTIPIPPPPVQTPSSAVLLLMLGR